MSNLDEKLREILRKEVDGSIEYGEGVNAEYYGIDFEDIIAQTKQAFEDEGYENTLAFKRHIVSRQQLIDEMNQPVMTGQAWYDSFEKDLKGELFFHGETSQDVINAVNRCMEAAKKTSGIKEESQSA